MYKCKRVKEDANHSRFMQFTFDCSETFVMMKTYQEISQPLHCFQTSSWFFPIRIQRKINPIQGTIQKR